MDEGPRKRARIEQSCEGEAPVNGNGHRFGDIYISGSASVQLGDRPEQNQPPSSASTGVSHVEKYETLLKSLLFDRIDARVHNVKKALSRTCNWLFQHEDFKEWRSPRNLTRHNGFLWIKGKPGCGKSTIMKTALERTRKDISKHHTDQIVLHYFFNARAPTSLEKSSLGLYRSLVYQLLNVCSSLRSPFVTKFALKEPEDSDDAWTKAELQDFLCDVIAIPEPPSLCIFIDALDEGEHEDDVRSLISFLVDLAEQALSSDTPCRLRICLSSRHYPHISIRKGMSLVVEDQLEHLHDIDTYIRQKLIGSNGGDKDELSIEIRSRSCSIFLWVVLVVDMLNKIDDHGSLLTDMKTRLSTIPSDLNELFQEILTKSVHSIETSIALLQWMVFSVRLLEPQELYLAVEHSRSPTNPNWSPPHEIKVPPTDHLRRYILNASRGLVELTTTKTSIVQFIHETVREFLISKNGLASLLPSSTNLVGLSHEILKTSCDRYISKNKIPYVLEIYISQGHSDKNSNSHVIDTVRTQLPFMSYAASNLFAHAEQAQKNQISQDVFLKNKVDWSGLWFGQERLWWNVLERFTARKYASEITLLYFLAEQGYACLVSTLISLSNNVDASCGRYGTALQAACVGGHKQTVLTLINAGADVNQRGGEHGHPLIAALMNKRFQLLPILQGHDARPDASSLQSVLFKMIARGSLETVAAVLDIGADVNGQNKRYKTPLYMAVEKCNVPIVDLLLQKGADVNKHNGTYKLSLFMIFEETYLRIVQALLKAGVNVNALHGQVGSPLQAASLKGYLQVVQILLDAGVGVDGPNPSIHTNPLHIASKWGHLEIVQALLNAGAVVDISRPSNYLFWSTALQVASSYGHLQVVQALLNAGADVNVEAGDHGTALTAASRRGHLEVVRVLLEAGAFVNGQDADDALLVAIGAGHLQVVQILLNAGAEVKHQAGYYDAAMDSAMKRNIVDFPDLLKIIREHGADVSKSIGSNMA